MMSMPTAQIRLPRRRWWVRWLIMGLFASPVLFFLLSNAWLQTGWGRGWVERQIFQRSSLTVRIGGSGWLPGGQVWIDDLRLLASAATDENDTPLLHIRCLSIRPAWSSWIRGSRKISDVCLSSPRLTVPLERLKEWLPAPQAPPAAAPPAVVASAPPTAAPAAPVVASATPVASPAPAPAEEIPSPTVWLKISDGSLTVSHLSQSLPLLQIGQISAELPIGGAPASGHVQCAAIRSLEETLSPVGRIAIRWKYPLWESEATPFTAAALQANARVQIARVPGLPFAAVIAQDKQAWQDPSVVQAQEIQSLHRINGFLLGPHTWQGESLCEASQLRLQVGGKDLSFFRAQSRFLLRSGMLQCTDLRLLGDEAGVLGNGLCTMRGDWIGQLRVLVPRATAEDWRQRWARISPRQPLPFQTALSDDRPMLDFLCGGNFEHPRISLDQGKSWHDARTIRTLWQQPPIAPTP